MSFNPRVSARTAYPESRPAVQPAAVLSSQAILGAVDAALSQAQMPAASQMAAIVAAFAAAPPPVRPEPLNLSK